MYELYAHIPYTQMYAHTFVYIGVCENGALRLVNSSGGTGEGVMSGRVEICWNAMWGTVCNHNWSLLDAAVVCYELGFSRYSEFKYCSVIIIYRLKSKTFPRIHTSCSALQNIHVGKAFATVLQELA